MHSIFKCEFFFLVNISYLVPELSFTLALNPCSVTFSLPPNTLPGFDPISVMSASTTLEEKFEALMMNYESMTTNNEELKNQNAYLRRQHAESIRQKRRNLVSSSSSSLGSAQEEDNGRNNPHLVSSSEEEPPRRRERRPQPSLNDFKVDIPDFEGKLDPDEFFEWMQIVERIFDFEDIPEERKVKLVALKLRKYASLW